MQIRATAVGLLSCGLILFGEVNAQTTSSKVSDQTIPGDIIFEVPINLTRLSPYVSKVAVTCQFGLRIDPNLGTIGTTSGSTEVLYKKVELPVSAGQVVTTAQVVVTVPSTPDFKPGQSLMYQCALSALSSEPMAGNVWYPLDQKVPVASLQVSPVPVPITGTFTW
jgi:hypothetical protein